MKKSTRQRTLLLVAAVLVLGALTYFGRLLPVEEGVRWVGGLGPLGPVALVVLYVVATVAFVPGTVPTLAAGALFGLGIGSAVAIVGSNLGAAAAFLVARTIGRKPLERRLRGQARMKALDAAVRRKGFGVVLLTRLSPAIPFNLSNYAYGLTGVSFRDYALGSLLGMAPFTVAYVYVGTVLGTVVGTRGESRPKTTLEWVLLSAGLAISVAVSIWLAIYAKKVLAKHEKATR